MLFNLGSAYCLRSEYDKARKCLHQVRLERALPGALVSKTAGGLEFIEFVILFEASGQFLKNWGITFLSLKIFSQGKQLIHIASEPRHLMEIFRDDFNN